MGIESLLDWLRSAPPGTTVAPDALVEILEAAEDAEPEPTPAPPLEPVEATWRERLWVVPAETRLGTREVLEALGRSRSWLYRHLGEDQGADRLPHRKLDGELVFTAGELRAWLRRYEEVIAAGPMESRTLSLVADR